MNQYDEVKMQYFYLIENKCFSFFPFKTLIKINIPAKI